jgi:phage tail-like protein
MLQRIPRAIVFVALLAATTLALRWVSAPASGIPEADAQRAIHIPPGLQSYTIDLLIDGNPVANFRELRGLESEIEILEYRDGTDPIARKRPGRVKYSNIVLKRGQVTDDSLWAWHVQNQGGSYVPKQMAMVILDDSGQEVVRYNLFECWPCRWKGPELNRGAAHIVEELEFAVERVERA